MVEDWFASFIGYLQAAVPRPDWPSKGDPYWPVMRSALVRCGATEDDARDAVDLIVESPPQYLDRFISGLVESVRMARDSRRGRIGDVPKDRAEAEAESRDCPECSGCGMTVRRAMVRPRIDRPAFEASIGVICHMCVAGRWIARRQAEDPPKDRRTILDLADYPGLWPEEFKYAPAPPKALAKAPETAREVAR